MLKNVKTTIKNSRIYTFLFRTQVELRVLRKDNDGRIRQAENLNVENWVSVEEYNGIHKLQHHGGSKYRAIPTDFASTIADENDVCAGGILRVFDTKTKREFLIMPNPLKGGDRQR